MEQQHLQQAENLLRVITGGGIGLFFGMIPFAGILLRARSGMSRRLILFALSVLYIPVVVGCFFGFIYAGIAALIPALVIYSGERS